MMRGQRYMAVAVRAPSSEIVVRAEELPKRLYQGPIPRIPFLRGSIVLWDTLGLGMRALMYLALAAYATYVINATQFLLKLRAARMDQARRSRAAPEPGLATR